MITLFLQCAKCANLSEKERIVLYGHKKNGFYDDKLNFQITY